MHQDRQNHVTDPGLVPGAFKCILIQKMAPPVEIDSLESQNEKKTDTLSAGLVTRIFQGETLEA